MNTVALAQLLPQLPERLQSLLETHHGLVTQQQLLEAGVPAYWLAYLYSRCEMLFRLTKARHGSTLKRKVGMDPKNLH
jgi:hypothetical protein